MILRANRKDATGIVALILLQLFRNFYFKYYNNQENYNHVDGKGIKILTPTLHLWNALQRPQNYVTV